MEVEHIQIITILRIRKRNECVGLGIHEKTINNIFCRKKGVFMLLLQNFYFSVVIGGYFGVIFFEVLGRTYVLKSNFSIEKILSKKIQLKIHRNIPFTGAYVHIFHTINTLCTYVVHNGTLSYFPSVTLFRITGCKS